MKSCALIGIIVLALSTHCATALRCYDCSSGADGYCAVAFSTLVTDCHFGFQCIKLWTDHSIVRKCGPPAMCNMNIPDDHARCESCNEDLCNAADVGRISIPMAALFTGAILAQQVSTLGQRFNIYI